jgi:hypothetical protein
MSGRHEQAQPLTSRAPLAILAVVLVLAVSNVIVGQTLGGRQGADNSGASPQQPSAAAGLGPTTTAPAPTPTASRVDQDRAAVAKSMESCRLSNLRHQAAMGNAAVSLAQFHKHIDAMNLLVAGKISLAVATTFWDQTRVAATENAAAFRTADKVLTSSTIECAPLPSDLASAAAPSQANVVSACAAAVTSRGEVMRLARTTVATWEHHVHEMEMLRTGQITPAQATAAWQKSWKTGDKQLKAYQAALASASKTDCPLI